MADGILTKDTKLFYKLQDSSTTTSYVEVTNLISTPAVGEAPDTVEITNLSNDKRRYIRGLQDVGQLEFGLIYEPYDSTDHSNYYTLKQLESEDDVDWKIEYPDGVNITFSGQPFTVVSETAVGERMEMTLSITVTSEYEVNFS